MLVAARENSTVGADALGRIIAHEERGRGIVVWVWLARCRDGNPLKFCRVIPNLFGYFFGIPSLHAFSFLNDFYISYIYIR